MYRLIFLGTPEFAVPSLQGLINDGRFEIVGVITQPDRIVGRQRAMTAPPIKKLAQQHQIPIYQPEKLDRTSVLQFLGLSVPDVLVVVAYGKILPQWFLDIPRHGAINVHASLLPRWRGASPIQAAIAAGDKTTGVTIMKMDAELDHGPILAQEEESILDTDTGGSLSERLSKHGAEILPDALADYLSGRLTPREQDHSLSTTCRTLRREDGKIDWTKTSDEIEGLIRAYNPWPGTWTEINEKRLKVLSVRVAPVDQSKQLGQRFVRNSRPHIACGRSTVLELVTVQTEGKKLIRGEEYIRGNSEFK